jgi:hypothetical protein
VSICILGDTQKNSVRLHKCWVATNSNNSILKTIKIGDNPCNLWLKILKNKAFISLKINPFNLRTFAP